VLRTEATDEADGFMKVVVSANDDRILGFSMIGSEAGEVMVAIQTAILSGLPYPKLREAVIAHLTFAEGIRPSVCKCAAAGGIRDRRARIAPCGRSAVTQLGLGSAAQATALCVR
jgi:hypothetical protein